MQKIRAAPHSPCGKPGCINKICNHAPYCTAYQNYIKAIKQKRGA